MMTKVCGITTQADAQLLVENQVEMIGFIFVPSSPRYLTLEKAQSIIKTIRGKITTVAVFRDQPLSEVQQVLKKLKPDMIQLHGSESPEFCKHLNTPVIKALTLDNSIDKSRSELLKYASVCDFILIDRKDQGRGPVVNLTQVKVLSKEFKIILAGGLNPENIIDIMTSVGKVLAGIDVSSGVEAKPGIKDPQKLKTLIENVHGLL